MKMNKIEKSRSELLDIKAEFLGRIAEIEQIAHESAHEQPFTGADYETYADMINEIVEEANELAASGINLDRASIEYRSNTAKQAMTRLI